MENQNQKKTVLLIDEGLGEFKNGKKLALEGMLIAIHRLNPGFRILPVSSKQDYEAIKKNEEYIQNLYMVFIGTATESFGGTLELMISFPATIKINPLDYMGSITEYIKSVASGIKATNGESLEIIRG
ncbi:hypothetical protein J4465_01275 [Candidatus Pacearchaeota archaeon]|nr:hypothetical protein [Candidatus Pacearchaeota archaeon]